MERLCRLRLSEGSAHFIAQREEESSERYVVRRRRRRRIHQRKQRQTKTNCFIASRRARGAAPLTLFALHFTNCSRTDRGTVKFGVAISRNLRPMPLPP